MPNPLLKLLRLPAPDRRLLLEAALLQGAVRLALWFLPVRMWHRPSACVGIPDTVSPARIAWAIAVSARVIPRSTCLVRALAARRLLARHGYPSTLRLGVARAPQGLDAHAWLECDGAILIGGPASDRYTCLSSPYQPNERLEQPRD